MSDIFISYAQEDQDTAQDLAAALQARGWSVWWDRHLTAGEDWDKVIERELATARCIVVLWSKISVQSQWVFREAKGGLERRILVPARIEAVAPPRDFHRVQAADLTNWNGHVAHPGFEKLVAAIAARLRAPVWKRILQARAVVFLTAILLALILTGWDQPLKHLYSPSAVEIRLVGPPPVASPAKPALIYHGHRADDTAMGLDRDISRRFEMDNNIEIVIDPHEQEDRLATLRRVFNDEEDYYDIVMIDIIWAGEFGDHLIDLKSFFEKEGKFDETIIKNIEIEGKLVAVPWFQNIGLLFYRKDLLDDYNNGNVPANWKDLEDTAKKIQKMQREKGNPNFYGYAWQGFPYEGLMCNALEWIASEGALDAKTGLPDFDHPELLNALYRAWRWINEENGISHHAKGHREWDSLQMFRNGNAAFYRGWSNDYAWLKQSGIEFGVALLPRGRVEKNFAVLGGWNLAVPKYSQNPGWAIKFIRYLSSSAIQEWRAEEGSFEPADKTVDAKEYLAPPLKENQNDNIQPIVRPSLQLGERYNSVSSCIYNLIYSALTGQPKKDGSEDQDDMERKVKEMIGQKIDDMKNCI